MAMRANMVFQGKKLKNGACAISEHYLIIFKRNTFKNLVLLELIHQLQFVSIQSFDQYSIEIKTKMHSVKIWNGIAIRFARCLLRNCIISTLGLPIEKRVKLIAHDMSEFPPFKPEISPSQMLQFCYNSYCSLLHTEYNQHVVRLLHKFITTGNSIIDFSHLPLSEFDYTFASNKINLRPIFDTLRQSQFVTGIQCSNVNRPDFLYEAGHFFLRNRRANILSITNLNITSGAYKLAKSFVKNHKMQLLYLDLSENNIEDINEIAVSLEHLCSPLFYLNLNDSHLNSLGTLSLFNSIRKNKMLRNLTHLFINNATIKEDACKMFSEHISNLVNNFNINILNTLDLGCIRSGAKKLFKTFADCHVPLEVLKVAGSKFDLKDIRKILYFLKKSQMLLELDISNTNICLKDLRRIMYAIQANTHFKSFTIHLNSLKLHGKRLNKVLEVFKDFKPLKWIGISLADNDMSANDIKTLNSVFHRMLNLQWLDLSGNVSKSMKHIEIEIANLITIPRLDFLALRGNGRKVLNRKLIEPFVETLINSEKSIGLDLRYNNFSDKAMMALRPMLLANKLTEFLIERNKPKKIEPLVKICKRMNEAHALVNFCYPTNDVYSLMKRNESKKKKKYNQIMNQIETSRIWAMLAVMANQTGIGYHSVLSFKRIMQLDELIDESILTLNDILKAYRPNCHSIISDIVGLPLPFQNKGQRAIDLKKIQDLQHKRQLQQQDPYQDPLHNPPPQNRSQNSFSQTSSSRNLSSRNQLQQRHKQKERTEDEVKEQQRINILYRAAEGEVVEESMEGLNTLQYNSLCLRRPGTSIGYQMPEAINEMIYQSRKLAEERKEKAAKLKKRSSFYELKEKEKVAMNQENNRNDQQHLEMTGIPAPPPYAHYPAAGRTVRVSDEDSSTHSFVRIIQSDSKKGSEEDRNEAEEEERDFIQYSE